MRIIKRKGIRDRIAGYVVCICAILVFSFIFTAMAIAQEDFYEPDDTPQDACLIIPNGASQIHVFKYGGDEDWVKFFTEGGVTYQIFTRPKNAAYSIDTIISLYDERVLSYSSILPLPLAINDDFVNDFSSLINWQCPATGIYYLLIESYSGNTYSPYEAYSIQVMSVDRQDQDTGKILSGVPDYLQSDFVDPGNCGPVSAACILGYWDSHGYDLLVDNDPASIIDVSKLVDDLQRTMLYPSLDQEHGGVKDQDVPTGIINICNAKEYNNGYLFSASLIYNKDYDLVIDEITQDRPLLYGIMGHSVWKDHWMVTIGYLKTQSTLWTINHDTWDSTPRDVYVDWDEATDCIVTVHPGKYEASVEVESSFFTSQQPSNNFYNSFNLPGIQLTPVNSLFYSPLAKPPILFFNLFSSFSGYPSQTYWGNLADHEGTTSASSLDNQMMSRVLPLFGHTSQSLPLSGTFGFPAGSPILYDIQRPTPFMPCGIAYSPQMPFSFGITPALPNFFSIFTLPMGFGRIGYHF